MDKPVPDGYIVFHPAHPNLSSETYDFRDIKSLVIEDRGFRVRLERGSDYFPDANILKVEHVHNSLAYVEALRQYQEQHEHTWVFGGDYNYNGPVPGFYWYCGPNMAGDDEGCGKPEFRQHDDLDRTIEEVRRGEFNVADE